MTKKIARSVSLLFESKKIKTVLKLTVVLLLCGSYQISASSIPPDDKIRSVSTNENRELITPVAYLAVSLNQLVDLSTSKAVTAPQQLTVTGRITLITTARLCPV